MISSRLLIIYLVITVCLLRSLKGLDRSGLWNLLVKVRVEEYFCLISCSRLHNGKMNLDGNLKALRLNLMLYKDTLWTRCWLEAKNLICVFMYYVLATNHWLSTFIGKVLEDSLILGILIIWMIFQILICILRMSQFRKQAKLTMKS